MRRHDRAQLALLGGAELHCHGDQVRLPLGAHRLLGFLALQAGAVPRHVAAAALWPTHRAHRAVANLRSALWQARRIGTTTIIDCAGQRMRLSTSVEVDLREVTQHAQQINAASDTNTTPNVAASLTGYRELVAALSRDLLPDWSDGWLVIERERWNQVRLHALETLASRLLTAGQHLPALEVALTAVAIEPIRESAHRTVIEIHIAEGNAGCAIKHYHRYRQMLQRELGVPPSPQMDRLMRTLVIS